MRSRARGALSRIAVALEESPSRFGSVDDITDTDGLRRLGKSTQSFWIGLDLLGLPEAKVSLNGVGNLLAHTTMIPCSGRPDRCIQFDRKSQCHSHTIMVPIWAIKMRAFRLKAFPWTTSHPLRSDWANQNLDSHRHLRHQKPFLTSSRIRCQESGSLDLSGTARKAWRMATRRARGLAVPGTASE